MRGGWDEVRGGVEGEGRRGKGRGIGRGRGGNVILTLSLYGVAYEI